jgi:N-acetylneuraminic acid mutarotase
LNATEGIPFSGVVGSFVDADPTGMASDYTASIAWGDGTTSAGTITLNPTGGFNIVGSHTYTEEGPFTIDLTATDKGGAVAVNSFSAGLSPMPTGLSEAASFGTDGKLYVFGGISNGITGSGEVYDPVADTWSSNVPAMPSPRIQPATTRGADGKIYVISGFDQTLYAVSTVETFDPTSQTWTTGLPGLNIPRIGAVAATGPDGTLYVFGGVDNNNHYLSSVEAYSPGAAAWTVLSTPMPAGFESAAAAVGPGGWLYLFGGQNGISSFLNTAYAYNFATGQWKTLAVLPTTLAGAAAAAGPDGRIYVFGGWTSPGSVPSTNAVEAYDPATDSWGPAAPLMTARAGGAALVGPDGRIYLVGGIAAAEAYTVGTAVAVADAPLAASGAGAALQLYAGAVSPAATLASFTDADSGATAGDYTATIYWGGGQVSTGTVQANQTGGFDVSGAHTYSAAGGYSIRVHVADAGGAAVDIAASAQVAALVSGGPNLTIQGDAFGIITNDSIIIDNTASGTQVTVNGVTFSYGPGVIQSFTVNPGGGTNTVTLLGLTASVPFTFNGQGVDTVNIGSSANSLDPIQGAVSVYGGGGSTTLNLDDQGGDSEQVYQLSATQLLRYPAPPPGQGLGAPTQTINYSNVNHLTLQGSGAANIWYVNGTAAGTATDLSSNGGSPGTENAFIVWALGRLQGLLALHGDSAGGGYDFVRAYDPVGSVGHTYTLTTGAVQRDGVAGLTYDGIDELTVYTDLNSYGYTSSSNTINVQSLGNLFAAVAAAAGDTVTIGQNGSMSQILGTLEIVAGPQQVTLDDSADTQTGKQVTFATGFFGWDVSGLSPGQVYLPLGAGSSVQVRGGSPTAGATGGNSYSIQSVPAGVSLNLNAGKGTDTVNVGSGIPAGMVSLWQGDGNANDLVGKNNGTVPTGVTFAPGVTGAAGDQAFRFNGSNALVDVGHDPSLNMTGSMTVSAWVNVQSLIANNYLFADFDSGGRLSQGSLGIDAGGRFFWFQGNQTKSNDWVEPHGATAVSLNQWHHVAVVRDDNAKTITLYVDGLPDASVSYAGIPILALQGDKLLGGSGPGFPSDSFNGLLDEVGVYNRALSATEILGLFHSGGTSPETLDPIQGGVTVNGTGGTTTLNVYDQGTSSLQYYVVSATQITRAPYDPPNPPRNPTQTINYFNMAHVNVYGSNGADGWNARSTLAGTTTALYSGGGGVNHGNEFIVENTADVLDDIQGPLALHAGGIYDFAFVYDGLNAVGHTYTLTTGMVQRDGMANITYDGGLGELIVQTANNPYSGHTPNTVYVQSLGKLFAAVAVGKNDTVTVGQNGSMAGIVGDVRIQGLVGQVPKQVTLDASADNTAHTVTLGSDPTFGYLVNGLANSSQGLGRLGLQLDPVTPVSIRAGAGNDVVRVRDLTGIPALTLDAGGGTNTLDYSPYTGDVMVDLPKAYATGFASIKNIQNVIGSNGNNLLVGNGTGNVLTGGTGRNVLIGRGGGATLEARTSLGNDILIGGTTDWDMNLPALQAIMSEWDRTDLAFADRRADLLGNSNSLGLKPLNVVGMQKILLTPATNPTSTNGTVHADTTKETLLGGLNAANWFFEDAGGTDTDNYSSKRGDKRSFIR